MSTSQRRIIFVLLILGTLIALAGAAAVFMQRQARLRGALNGLPPADLPQRVPVLGVNADLAQYDTAALSENLDQIAAQGFRWVRQPFRWSAIEPQAGQYDWSATDAIVEAASTRGLKLVAVLIDAPAWAAPQPSAPPDDPDVFGTFAGALAARYGDRIDVYQIWDEPNLSSGWGGQPPSAVAYAAMLEAAYMAIHAADPQALVLTAGLAPTRETGPDNVSDVLYLRALYDSGAAPYFDGVAGKPYGFDTGPDDRRIDANLLNFSRFVLLREEMVRHGDESKPLWAADFGWNVLPPGWSGEPSVWGQTTPAQQAGWTLEAYQRALTEWPWAGGMMLDTWQPSDGSQSARWGFALRGPDGALSPTALAVGNEAARINGALWPGVYRAAAPLVAYSGHWKFSDLGADIGQEGDSAVDVPFAGSSLAVIARRDNYRAYLYVTVDGRPSDALPQDERGAYLVLTSPDYMPHVEEATLADGLAQDASHTAHIEADRGWDQWAIAGWAVGAHIPTLGYDATSAALALVALGLAVLAVRTARGLESPGGLQRAAGWLTARLGAGLHLALAVVAALSVWLGAALTWGGLVPNLVRRAGEGPSLLITALTAGVFYFSPWLVLTLVALVVLFVLIYTRPGAGLALIMFFTPFYLLPRPLFDRAFSMVEVTTLLTFAAWAIHIAAERKDKGWPSVASLWQQMTGLDKAIGLFIAISFVSLAWADLLGVAVTELRQIILEPFVVYLVLRTMPLEPRERWQIVDLLVLTGTLVALIGLYEFVTGVDVITAEAGARRLRSVFGSPNSAALNLGRIIPIAAAVALVGGNKWRRWLYGAAGVVMLAAAALTLSKGSVLLGIPAGLALVVILWAGKKGLIVVIAGAVLEGLALIPLSRMPRFADLLDFTSGTSTSFFRLASVAERAAHAARPPADRRRARPVPVPVSRALHLANGLAGARPEPPTQCPAQLLGAVRDRRAGSGHLDAGRVLAAGLAHAERAAQRPHRAGIGGRADGQYGGVSGAWAG